MVHDISASLLNIGSNKSNKDRVTQYYCTLRVIKSVSAICTSAEATSSVISLNKKFLQNKNVIILMVKRKL